MEENLELFEKLLKDLGPPTPHSLEHLRRMELDCEERKDPNSFYLNFTISHPPVISWSHNADRQLGIANLEVTKYFDHIHPDWLPIHIGFGSAAYFAARKAPLEQRKERPVYTTNIPLRNKDGEYYWYNQVSFPAAFDNKGRMLSHLNQYHRLCAFDKLVPTRPKLTINDEWQSEYDQDFARAGNAALATCLTEILTPSNYRILQAYRSLTIARDGKWISPAKKSVRETLGLSAIAINKANVRIIQSVKGRFPDSVTHDVATFSAFLNDLCGLPLP